jgi:hypothetical protein
MPFTPLVHTPPFRNIRGTISPNPSVTIAR